MSYSVRFERNAEKEAKRLPKTDRSRVLAAIVGLRDQPRPPGCKKLTGRDGWRIRVGMYRVIYDIEDAIRIVTIERVANRRDAYR